MASECITVQKAVGVPTENFYSDLAQIQSQVESEMRLYAYKECNDENGDLISFVSYLQDYSEDRKEDTKVQLSRIGEEPTSENEITCNGHSFPKSYINQAAIYHDEKRIYGMRLKSGEGFQTKLTDIGSLKGSKAELSNFSSQSQLIGFYGSSDGQVLT